MTQEEIISGNRIIDTFNDLYLLVRGYSVEELNYHKDWNNLMKVVEKIEQTPYPINKGYFMRMEIHRGWSCVTVSTGREDDYRINRTGKTKIESVWSACVDFIKWYNQQQEEK